MKDFAEGMTDVLGAIASIPILGKIFNVMTDHAGTHLEKKAGELFGLSSEAADQTTDDESLFEKAIVDGTLSPAERKSIMTYLGWLRVNNPKLAKEWVRWVYNTLVKFERKVKKTSGTKDNKEERTSTDYTDGILVVENLFHDIIIAPNETVKESVLLQRNICVKEKKLAPAVGFAKEKVRKVADVEKANRKDFNETASSWAERAKAWRENR